MGVLSVLPKRTEPVRIARWDLDKTYLRTDFETLRDLVRTALEKPERKRSVPGAAALLRELARSGNRVHVLSGSPRQMRARLLAKLELDRVMVHELSLKPNLKNLLTLRFRALRDQLGYKLPELLAARVRDQGLGAAGDVKEVLVGDDAEADAFVYSLYADLCARKLSGEELSRVLSAGHVYKRERRACFTALARIQPAAVTERILIHLDRQTPPSRFDVFGKRLVPFFNYFQAACVLFEDGWIDTPSLLKVASELVIHYRFDADALSRSYFDLVRRDKARGDLADRLEGAFTQRETQRAIPVRFELERMLRRVQSGMPHALEGQRLLRGRQSAPPMLDYLELAKRHRGGRNRHEPVRQL